MTVGIEKPSRCDKIPLRLYGLFFVQALAVLDRHFITDVSRWDRFKIAGCQFVCFKAALWMAFIWTVWNNINVQLTRLFRCKFYPEISWCLEERCAVILLASKEKWYCSEDALSQLGRFFKRVFLFIVSFRNRWALWLRFASDSTSWSPRPCSCRLSCPLPWLTESPWCPVVSFSDLSFPRAGTILHLSPSSHLGLLRNTLYRKTGSLPAVARQQFALC